MSGKQPTHVPAICAWAVSRAGLFPGLVGALTDAGWGNPLENISLF